MNEILKVMGAPATLDDVLNVLLRIETLLQTKATQKAKPSAEEKVSTSVLWAAYSEAFERLYKVKPERNASVNGMIAQVVKRVPAAEHAALGEFFVRQTDWQFTKQMHSAKALLSNVEMLLTRMRSGVVITDSKARQIENAQGNLQASRDYLARKHGEKNGQG